MPKTILIADDHPFCQDVIQLCLEQSDLEANLIGLASLAELATTLRQLAHCDLLVLDLGLADSVGIDTLKTVRERWPDVPVLVFSANDNLQLQHLAREMGARGFLPKSKPVSLIAKAIEAILEGGSWFDKLVDAVDSTELEERFRRAEELTLAQRRVLAAMRSGALNKQIAHSLGISEITVKAHIKAILSKMDVDNRTQAVLEINKLLRLGFRLDGAEE